jgi:hypothetical protein
VRLVPSSNDVASAIFPSASTAKVASTWPLVPSWPGLVMTALVGKPLKPESSKVCSVSRGVVAWPESGSNPPFSITSAAVARGFSFWAPTSRPCAGTTSEPLAPPSDA